jgi:hypothetical protein
MHAIECHSNGSGDETSNCFVAEFVWPAQARSVPYSSLKPIHKNQQEEMKFTFDVLKCDRIFDEMLKNGYIKLSHLLLPLDELKHRAYCKRHNSASHSTNDWNVFRRQVQSTINEGQLSLSEMHVDTMPLPG